MTDYRLVWLRDRISKILGVQDHPETLETLISEQREAFISFLEAEVTKVDESEKCLFYIYRTFYDRLVEKEVVTIEKGKQFEFTFSPSSSYLPDFHSVNKDWPGRITISLSFPFHSSTNYDTTASWDWNIQREKRKKRKR